MLQFFIAENLKSATMVEAAPWDFKPSQEELERVQKMAKSERRAWIKQESTKWNVYSCVRGVCRGKRIDKENHPVALRGIVADYDSPMDDAGIKRLLACIKERDFHPNFIERSLSGNVRLVWVFEREVLVPNNPFCDRLLATLSDILRLPTLLAGYDQKSTEPAQVWTNGGVWECVKDTPVPWPILFGIVCATSEKVEDGSSDIPLDVVYDEVERRWPGRWRGPFEVNRSGVRFWDDRADNPEGCRVKPDGIICFTGTTPFMSWEQIFGVEWCNSKRAVNLGKSAGETYFDGRNYWQLRGDRYQQIAREDLCLWLKNTAHLSGKLKRGQTVTDVERVLAYIQDVNRVDGAGPLVNRPPGLQWLNNKRLLNTYTFKVLQPVGGTPTTADFAWTWDYLQRLFGAQKDAKPLDHFLAWLRRFYVSFYEYQRRMGQAIFLCGPRENGKTLLSYRVIKPLLGDTEANPYEYFTGLTSFNNELFETPLLLINDEEATTKEEVRQKFMARIKSFVVNPSHSYHPKYCARIRVEWTGRIFITLNDDVHSVGLLPAKNPNTADKMMFFRSFPRGVDWEPTNVIESTIARELPFFARWLLNWTPPDYVVAGGRMGVKSYFDPDVLENSKKQNYHYTFLEVLQEWCKWDQITWKDGVADQTWEGSPTALLGTLNNANACAPVMKEWTTTKVARAVSELIRNDTPGLEFVDGLERIVRVHRDAIADPRSAQEQEGLPND